MSHEEISYTDVDSLLEEIHKDPETLELCMLVRFRRRRRSSYPRDFSDFLQALRASQSIKILVCYRECALDLNLGQVSRMIRAFGQMPNLQKLAFRVKNPLDVSFEISLRALGEALRNGQHLTKMLVGKGVEVVRASTAETEAFSDAASQSELEDFYWCGHLVNRNGERIPMDTFVESLVQCSTLKRASFYLQGNRISYYALRQLIQAPSLEYLWLTTNDFVCAANAIGGNPQSTLRELSISSISFRLDVEELVAFAGSVGRNSSLTKLEVCTRLSDRVCIAFANALEQSNSLEQLTLEDNERGTLVRTQDTTIPGRDTYEAFTQVLETKPDVKVKLNLPFILSRTRREECTPSRRNFEIQNRLNEIGRPDSGSKAEWVEALIQICKRDSNVRHMPDWEGRPALYIQVGLVWDCLYLTVKANPCCLIPSQASAG